MLKVICSGDRKWTDSAFVERVLLAESDGKGFVVCEGNATGLDKIAGAIADKKGWPHFICPANWNYYDRAAGHIRNHWMFDFFQPNKVFCFHDDIVNSKGTKEMLNYAQKNGCEVKLFSHE